MTVTTGRQEPGQLSKPLGHRSARRKPSKITQSIGVSTTGQAFSGARSSAALSKCGSARRYVNAMLAGPYRALFDPIHLMVFIEPPDLESSRRWRIEQEHKLRARAGAGRATMSDADLGRFVQHYERISRSMLADVPGSADVVITLDRNHDFRDWTVRSGG